jgi:hypothetical protein
MNSKEGKKKNTMSLKENKFDVVVIGTEAQRQKAIELLSSHGIRAGYISVDPASMSTFICQKWNDVPADQDEQAEMELVLQQHSFQTPQGETITYTLQLQAMEQEEELNFIEITPEDSWDEEEEEEEVLEELSAKFELDGKDAEIAESEEEIIPEETTETEEPETETADNTSSATSVPYYSPDELLAGKSLLWEQERAFQRRSPSNLLQNSLLGQQVFKLREETNQETDSSERPGEPLQQEQNHLNPNPNQNQTFTAKETFASTPQFQTNNETEKKEEPAPLFERELRLRKRLLSSNYRMKHRIQQSVLDAGEAKDQNVAAEKQEEGMESSSSEVYPIQPLSIRRRSRVHKKTRMLSNIELARKTPEPQPEEPKPAPSYLNKDEPTFESNFEDDFANHQETPATEPLKRDTIEFEEPFGNSWEDFLPPYSQGNRKRQELDKIEKRKIALRGLHNLINQLG